MEDSVTPLEMDKPAAPPAPPAAPTAAPIRVKDSSTQLQSYITRNEADIDRRQKALDEKQKTSLAQSAIEETQIARQEAADTADLAEFSRHYPKAQELPKPPTKQDIDPKQYQDLVYSIIGLAMVGGVHKGNWMGVSSALNGTMRGMVEGNDRKAAQQFEEYKTKFQYALEKQHQERQEYEDILNSKKLTINERIAQSKVIAAKYKNDAMIAAVDQRSIDQMLHRNEVLATSMANIENKQNLFTAGIEAKQQIQRLNSGAGRLTPQGEELVKALIRHGNYDIVSRAVGKFSSQIMDPIINQMAAEGDVEETAANLVESRAGYKAFESTLRMTEQRSAGVGRLTGSITRIQGDIEKLAAKVVPTGVPVANARINDIKAALGDPGIIELRNLLIAEARQYIEAVTMPGSNAQLHATSAEIADEMINANMSLSQIKAAFRAQNVEIAATSGALKDISQDLLTRIGRNGLKLSTTELLDKTTWKEKEDALKNNTSGAPTAGGAVLKFDKDGNQIK